MDTLSFKEDKNGLEYMKGVARSPRLNRCDDGFSEMDFGDAPFSSGYLLPNGTTRGIIKIDDKNYLLISLIRNDKPTVPNRLDLLITKNNVTSAENICKFKEKLVYK